MSELGIFYPNVPSGKGEIAIYDITETPGSNYVDYTLGATPTNIMNDISDGKIVYARYNGEMSKWIAPLQGFVPKIDEYTAYHCSFMFNYQESGSDTTWGAGLSFSAENEDDDFTFRQYNVG